MHSSCYRAAHCVRTPSGQTRTGIWKVPCVLRRAWVTPRCILELRNYSHQNLGGRLHCLGDYELLRTAFNGLDTTCAERDGKTKAFDSLSNIAIVPDSLCHHINCPLPPLMVDTRHKDVQLHLMPYSSPSRGIQNGTSGTV